MVYFGRPDEVGMETGKNKQRIGMVYSSQMETKRMGVYMKKRRKTIMYTAYTPQRYKVRYDTRYSREYTYIQYTFITTSI